MVTEAELRRKLVFQISPLLEVAVSLLVIQNPERFGPPPAWIQRVTSRLDEPILQQLLKEASELDLFALACDLSSSDLTAPEALAHLRHSNPKLGEPLLAYWEALAPEIAAEAGHLGASIREELLQLSASDPVDFLNQFSDRVSVSPDRSFLELEWGRGMRTHLDKLDRIVLVPSVFCPRRVLFYRHGATQYLFYNPRHRQAEELSEPPESLVLGFSALADATRLKLLKLIASEDLPAQEMARRLDLHESTVSRHLRFLVEAGHVARERQEGKYIFYTLNLQRLYALLATLRAYLGVRVLDGMTAAQFGHQGGEES